MIILRDYRIVKIDKLNYSFQVFKAPEDTATTKSLAPKWTPSYKYYGTISQALEGVKNDLLQAQFKKDYNALEFIQMLKELQEAINNLDIKINYEEI